MTDSSQVRICNVRARLQQIQLDITQVAQASHARQKALSPLRKRLEQTALEIDRSCQSQGLTSAHLSPQSRQFLAWIKFLMEECNLESHVETVRRAQWIAKSLLVPKRQRFSLGRSRSIGSNQLTVEFSNLTSVYRCTNSKNSMLLQASEGFLVADDTVLDALIKTVIFGKQPDTGKILKQFSASEEYSEVLLAMDLTLEPVNPAAQGKAYNLEELFERVNQQYFQGKIAKPQLAWSRIKTRRKFGHYEPARDRIVLSLTLDDAQVPAYAAEFVMYHEMLHIRHGATWRNGRRLVHTPAFRQDERKFEQYQSAEAELARLVSQR